MRWPSKIGFMDESCIRKDEDDDNHDGVDDGGMREKVSEPCERMSERENRGFFAYCS